MNTKESDPDTLQILDELNRKWVKLWKEAVIKKDGLKIFVTNVEKLNYATQPKQKS